MSSNDVPTSLPVTDLSINTDPVTRRVRDIYRLVATRPTLELVEVTAVSGGALTCRKIGTTTTIPNVIPVGWVGSMLPAVGEWVWIFTPQAGSQPFAVGVPAPNNPRTKVWQNGGFNLLNNAFTTFNMDATNWSEEFDQANGHDFVTNNSRIPIARDGIYAVEAAVSFAANATGIRGCYVALNGTTLQTKLTNVSNGVFGDTVSVSFHKECIAGNYFEFGYYQNSGGLLGCVVGICNTFLSVERIDDLG